MSSLEIISTVVFLFYDVVRTFVDITQLPPLPILLAHYITTQDVVANNRRAVCKRAEVGDGEGV